jgi:hypothetical protein
MIRTGRADPLCAASSRAGRAALLPFPAHHHGGDDMTFRSTRLFVGATTIATACLLGTAIAAGQAGPAPNPPQKLPLSDEVFKSITLLKGIPVDTFFEAMGMFANAMGNDCTFCHDKNAYFDKSLFATQTPRMMRARQMIVMMNTINKQFFGGATRVTCFTCHGGSESPKDLPNIALQYGPPFEDPNAMELGPDDRFTADQLFTRYLSAIGGAEQVSRATSFVATGTYAGFDTALSEIPVEIYSKAPAQLTMIVHMFTGDSVRTFDGRSAWMAGPDTPMPLVTLSGGNLDRARLEAMLWFPASLPTAFQEWRVGFAALGDKDVQVAQGLSDGQPRANFYFDQDGLLIRVVVWTRTPVGVVPTQIDYSDYRPVGGVKIPFVRTVSQTYMQMTVKLTDVKPNVQIDASRFAQPTPGGGARRRARQ